MRTLLVAELQDDQSLKVYYKQNNSIIDVGTFSSSKQLKNQWNSLRNKQTNSETAVREAQCTFARRSCAGFATMGVASTGLGVVAAATGVGAFTAAPALWSIGAISSILSLGCFAMFGGLPPTPPVLGNIPKIASALNDSYSIASGLSSLNDESQTSYRRGNRGIREPGNLPWDKPIADVRRKLGVDFCDKNIDDSGSQVAQRNESQERKICQVSDQFWKTHKRVIGPVNLEEHACIVPGAVMTSQGIVDGNEFCAVCYRTGNNTFGQPPDRALCSQPEDPARRNPVPNCPDNWAG